MSDLDDSDDESNVDAQDGNLDAVDGDGILSKNFYTFEKIVDIDGDFPDHDEMDFLVALVMKDLKGTAVRAKSKAFKQIQSFVAILCWDKVLKGKQEKQADLCLLMETHYRGAMTSLLLIEDYKKYIFNKFLPNKNFPDEYNKQADTVFTLGPCKGKKFVASTLNDWIKKHAKKYVSSDQNTKLRVYWGHQLIVQAKHCRECERNRWK
jgi:hypothetical protein